jgi:hypothetical protein
MVEGLACYDIGHAGRRKVPIHSITDRRELSDEVDRLVRDLAVMDESGKCLIINASPRTYELLQPG